MTQQRPPRTDLGIRLGHKPLSRTWAKAEILLGLLATGAGLLLAHWALVQNRAELEWHLVAGGLVLFVLGGYLTLAGHRSHLYQSNNELTAYLVEEIRRLQQ
jgi:hypothetical protein